MKQMELASALCRIEWFLSRSVCLVRAHCSCENGKSAFSEGGAIILIGQTACAHDSGVYTTRAGTNGSAKG